MPDPHQQNPIFIPGPTNMPDRLRAAINRQSVDHRAPGFDRFLDPLLADLKKVFRLDAGEVVVFPASGTGGWEAAVTNTLSPGDRVLAGRNGVFSTRWIELCERHGLRVDVIDCEWGEPIAPEAVRERLEADTKGEGRYRAVLLTHNETATGVRSDVAAVRRAMDVARHDAMLHVDCVSSLGSMDFRMGEWGVDVAVAGSQKGFMLPTGLAIVAFSKRALEASKGATCPRGFFDLGDMLGANGRGGFPYTPAMQLMYGLRASVDLLLEEGLERVFARHHRIAEGVRRAVAGWGFELCAVDAACASDSVSCIRVPEGSDSNALTDHAYRRYGVSFGIGLARLDGKAFRIGHLGSMTDVMALAGIAAAEMAMADLDFPIALGAGVAAAQAWYRESAASEERVAAAGDAVRTKAGEKARKATAQTA